MLLACSLPLNECKLYTHIMFFYFMFALRCSKLIFLDCFCQRNNYCQCRCYRRHIEQKQTEDQPKQFDREHILLFFCRKFRVFPGFSGFFWFFPVFSDFFGFFRFVSVVSLLYRNREFRCFNRTETNRRPTQTV